ncbi:Uncharacterised protein [Budvicia aquatica]|uniref:Uncharacterized protein n=1 Tax=Budvicia aquatica TaxID=82979 RepID=A0A484ZQ41_9GAMM|nr:Uncharacterised protein [Budvicia aquatica]
MRNIDLIHTVTRAAADRWPDVLANLGIDVPNSPGFMHRAPLAKVQTAFDSTITAGRPYL